MKDKKIYINQKSTAKNIKKIRIERNFSQAKLAKELNSSRTYYSSIENGKTKITQQYIDKLANFYKLEPSKIAIYDDIDTQELEFITLLMNMMKTDSMYLMNHQSLSDDLITINKYVKLGTVSAVNIIEPVLNNLDYELKLIDIHDIISPLLEKENYTHDEKLFLNSLANHITDQPLAIALYKYNTFVGLWGIDDFCKFEDYIHTSVEGYVNRIEQNFYSSKEFCKKTKLEQLNSSNKKHKENTNSSSTYTSRDSIHNFLSRNKSLIEACEHILKAKDELNKNETS